MASPHTAKRATAETVNALRNSEQLGGQLEIVNTPSDNTSQPETALAAALREAVRRLVGEGGAE